MDSINKRYTEDQKREMEHVKILQRRIQMEAVKQVRKTGEHVARIAAELGVNENNLYGWVKRSRGYIPFFVEAKSQRRIHPKNRKTDQDVRH